jgi:hypothetical protein
MMQAAAGSTSPASYAGSGAGSPPFYPRGYARLLLPMWGNGRIEMMLGAITGG